MSYILQDSAIELVSPIAVVAHDAGAANLMIGWLRDLGDVEIRIAVSGVAVELFALQYPELDNMPFEEAIENAAVLFSGTSSALTNFEHDARSFARAIGIPSIGVIDHWVNYEQRFMRDDCEVLPDEIWVSDSFAYRLAQKYFAKTTIRQLKNRYLEHQVEQIKAKSGVYSDHIGTHVLYVLEPISGSWDGSNVPNEFQALDFFISKLNKFELGVNVVICLRLHPSEAKGKYNEWCQAHPELNIKVDIESTLSELIAWADWVVGCQTVAMVIALNANKYTLSTLPPSAPKCVLPQKGIKMLRDLKLGIN
jgi:hypothetical protein